MNLREQYKKRIEELSSATFNQDQKELAKRMIDKAPDEELQQWYQLIIQKVQLGFRFDAAPEVSQDSVSLLVEDNKKRIKVKDVPSDDENILIIGENYDALKNLLVTHSREIDVIYIDPPYNTEKTREDGNNFGSKEDVDSNKFTYRDKYTTTGWLNMMNERLKLSKNLLSEEGVIFISIDDTHQAHLKLLMDQIFGEENFKETFIWEKNPNPTFLNKYSRSNAEYVIAYSKTSMLEKFDGGVVKSKETDAPLQNKGNPKRDILVKEGVAVFRTVDQTIKKGVYGLVEIDKDIIIKDGTNLNSFKITGTFRMTQETLYERIKNGETLLFKTNKIAPRLSYKAEKNSAAPMKFLASKDFGTNQIGNNELNFILSKNTFSYPKPVSLIKKLISLIPKKDVKILDFFAGSGTTGHATMQLNREDGGNRKFILVTNDQNKIGSEITYERLHRIIKGKGTDGDTKFKWLDKNQPYKESKLRVFNIRPFPCSLNDSVSELDKIAKEGFSLLDKNYDKRTTLDIYYDLNSLHPYKKEKGKQ